MAGKGSSFVVSKRWKEIALARLKQRGWNKAELARRLGVSRTAITDLFSKGKQSSLVPRIETLLGMPWAYITVNGQTVRTSYESDEDWQSQTKHTGLKSEDDVAAFHEAHKRSTFAGDYEALHRAQQKLLAGDDPETIQLRADVAYLSTLFMHLSAPRRTDLMTHARKLLDEERDAARYKDSSAHVFVPRKD